MNTRSSDWKTLATAPVDEQLARFCEAVTRPRAEDVNGGLRAFSCGLLAQDLIDMDGYVSVLGGHALNFLTPDGVGGFRDMSSGASASALTAIYSRAKYGSQKDIRFLAGLVIDYLARQLNDPASHWMRLFTSARENDDNVVLMTTGWRNVPSTANVLYDIVVEEINVTLAHMGLPTLINIKLPRIAPPCENYASMGAKERERVNLIQDHVIPAENFYRWSGVHVIFGDDVLVTGSTADKVLRESLLAGARSFQAIYLVAIDPRVALADATVEERLNMLEISHQLDDALAELLGAADYQPILRTLRLLFDEGNYEALPAFLARVPAVNWLRLYKAALGNEFLSQAECIPSLTLLRHYLEELGLLGSSVVVTERRPICV